MTTLHYDHRLPKRVSIFDMIASKIVPRKREKTERLSHIQFSEFVLYLLERSDSLCELDPTEREQVSIALGELFDYAAYVLSSKDFKQLCRWFDSSNLLAETAVVLREQFRLSIAII